MEAATPATVVAVSPGVEAPSLPGCTDCTAETDVNCQWKAQTSSDSEMRSRCPSNAFEQELRTRLSQIEQKLDSLVGKVALNTPAAVLAASPTAQTTTSLSVASSRHSSEADLGGVRRHCAWEQPPIPGGEEETDKEEEEEKDGSRWEPLSTRMSRMSEHEWIGSTSRCSGTIAQPVMRFMIEEQVDKLEQLVSREQVSAHKRASYRFSRGRAFEGISGAVIIMNALYIGYSADLTLDGAKQQQQVTETIFVGNCLFTLFFTLELLFRGWAERLLFVVGEEWKWNFFDFIIVTLSLIDMLLESFNPTGMDGVTVARILRLARFVKLMRMTRVMKHALSLRLVVNTILESALPLFWCFLVVGFVIYIFSVLFVYAAAENLLSNPLALEDNESLLRWYGNVLLAMRSLFMAISGGADWKELLDPLDRIHTSYAPIFIFYIFFMFFGVLNVVVGAFVATTSEAAKKDRDALVKGEINRLEGYTTRIKTFFQEADLDKSGTLSWEEFQAHLQNTKVKAYFQALELDVSQAHALFELLDTDGSNSVTVEEFLDGCLRLKGGAKNLDLHMLSHICLKFIKDVRDMKIHLLKGQRLSQSRSTSRIMEERPA